LLLVLSMMLKKFGMKLKLRFMEVYDGSRWES